MYSLIVAEPEPDPSTMPASYSLDAATTLTMTNNSGRYRDRKSVV